MAALVVSAQSFSLAFKDSSFQRYEKIQEEN
jgi:hypothetical protein